MKTLFKQIIFIFMILTSLVACQNSQPKLKPLPPGAIILALGDSLTYGSGATNLDLSYPQQLENLIGYKVINSGVPGEETGDALARVSNEVAQEHPQLVIVCLGSNDLFRQRSYDEIKDNLRKIIQIIQLSGAQVVLIGVPALGLNSEVPNFYQELGKEFDIPVDNKILPKLLQNSQFKSDDIHLNDEGYKLLAQNIANFLKEQGAL